MTFCKVKNDLFTSTNVGTNQSATLINQTTDNVFCQNHTFQVIFTGSPSGSVSLQVSNDLSTWTTITSSSVNISGSTDVNVIEPLFYTKNTFSPGAFKIVWTAKTNSTGSIQAYYCGN